VNRFAFLTVVMLFVALSVCPAFAGAEGLAADDALHSWSISTDAPVKPFVGVGILTEDSSDQESVPPFVESSPALYGLAAGVDCEVASKARVNLGYRYTTANPPDFLSLPLLPQNSNEEDHRFCVDLNLRF